MSFCTGLVLAVNCWRTILVIALYGVWTPMDMLEFALAITSLLPLDRTAVKLNLHPSYMLRRVLCLCVVVPGLAFAETATDLFSDLYLLTTSISKCVPVTGKLSGTTIYRTRKRGRVQSAHGALPAEKVSVRSRGRSVAVLWSRASKIHFLKLR